MKVIFYQRHPGTNLFSIETLFKSIRSHLPGYIESAVFVSSKPNKGVFRKLYNILEVLFYPQGDVNHITGDTHQLAFLLKKSKTILTIHDVNLMYSPNALKSYSPVVLAENTHAPTAIVTVISSTTKAELLKYVNYPPEKIRVIHNCVSPRFTPYPKAFNASKPVLLQIGTKPNKNLTRLIEALPGINCRLRIIGRPAPEAIALLEKHNIDFSWQSGLSDDQITQEYINCDMLVFVSTFEGFGLPIIEANTIERPVVTSNVSSMPEVAGQAACLVNPFDVKSIREGILQVIRDAYYREQLIRNGRLNRQRFSPQQIAYQYSQLYAELHDETRKTSPQMIPARVE